MEAAEPGRPEVGEDPDAKTSRDTSGSAIVTARGTGDGLVVRLDGRADRESLEDALRDFLTGRKNFVHGNEIAIEWVGRPPGSERPDDLIRDVCADFSVTVRSVSDRAARRVVPSETEIAELPEATVVRPKEPSRKEREPEDPPVPALVPAGDDPSDSRTVFGTLRSGQRLETDHSLVVFGDVNFGAEVVAGGDVVVLGTLRGVAHAGAYEVDGGGRYVVALVMKPTQIRIGSVFTRGASDKSDGPQEGPEIARVDGTQVVVERYHPRVAAPRARKK